MALASINVTINEVDCKPVTLICLARDRAAALTLTIRNHCHYGGGAARRSSSSRASFRWQRRVTSANRHDQHHRSAQRAPRHPMSICSARQRRAENDDIVSTVNCNSWIVQHQPDADRHHYIDATYLRQL